MNNANSWNFFWLSRHIIYIEQAGDWWLSVLRYYQDQANFIALIK